jgi:DNA-binding MarR family transcriptional regulator
MRYTYMMDDDLADVLDELDELLVRVRLAHQRPSWRRHLLEGSTHRLGLADLRVLRAVERVTDPSIRDVADQLGIEHSSASRAVASVVERGFLTRSSAAGDQRRTVLELTTTGRRALEEMTSRRRALVAETVVDWVPADLVRLTELLGRLADDFEADQ